MPETIFEPDTQVSDLPLGAKKVSLPLGVRLAEEPSAEPSTFDVVTRETAGQFIAGIQDITSLIVDPIRSVTGDIVFGPRGFQYVSPWELSKMKEAGVSPGLPGAATDEPASIFGKGFRVAGQTAALGPVLGKAAEFVNPVSKELLLAPTKIGRAGQTVGRGIQRFAHEAGQTFARAPVATTAVETGLGFSAGATGYVAGQIFPDSDAAVFIGEVIGGAAPALTPPGLAIRAAGGVREIYQKARHPFTEIGGRQRAIKRIQRAAGPEERRAALQELEQPMTLDPETGLPVLTPIQRTGDPGLLSLERAVMDSTEELRRSGDVKIAHANEVIQRSLEDLGGLPSAAEVPIKEAQDYLSTLLATRVRVAAQRADERIAELGPKASREQLNLVAREEAEKALVAARAQENELYDAFSPDLAAPFSRAKASLDTFTKQLGKAQQSDIPAIARRFLSEQSDEFLGKNIPEGFKAGETSIKELRALQSKLREAARNARVGDKKNLNKARIADDIANAITDDLADIAAGPETAKAIAVAVDFSRGLNERFSQGTMAKVLGRRIAGERVPAGLTLEESIGVTGPKAREALDDILKAFDSPEAPSSALIINASEDFTRGRFLKAAVVNGDLNARAAQRFVSQNEELLKRLPRVRDQIAEAIESGDALAVSLRQQKRVSLDDPKVSKATMLIEKGPVETFRQISRLKPDEAARETQKLINRVAHDKTGEALSGLKGGFLEFLYSTSREGARDIRGNKFMSGFALRETLQNVQSSANRLFSPDELKRLNALVDDLVRIEKRRKVFCERH